MTLKFTKHYQGPLGDFSYDPSQFIVTKADPSNNVFEDSIRYKGIETDGSKIKIPDGIVDCTHMFYMRDDLTSVPEIPSSVKRCNGMFYRCTGLTEPGKIPDGVESCRSMYSGCENLVRTPDIPDSVIDCSGMFEDCTSLTDATAHISDNARNFGWTFKNCKSLEKAPELPDSAANCFATFAGCTGITETQHELPAMAICCDYMYSGCSDLKNIPVFSPNLASANYMFQDCVKLDSSAYNMNGLRSVQYSKDMLTGCTSLPAEVVEFYSRKPAPGEDVYKFGESFSEGICYGLPTAEAYLEADKAAMKRNTSDKYSTASFEDDHKDMFANCVNLEKIPVVPEGTPNKDKYATTSFEESSDEKVVDENNEKKQKVSNSRAADADILLSGIEGADFDKDDPQRI